MIQNTDDVLDKWIKGARSAYEFFSKFAHPNFASVWTHYARTEMKIKVLDMADCSAMGAGVVCVQADPVMGLYFSPKWV